MSPAGLYNGDTLSPRLIISFQLLRKAIVARKMMGKLDSMTRSPLFPFLVIILAGIILTAPVLIYGIPFFSDDAVTHHAVWYVRFSEQLWAGDLYPRWLMGMNNGLGSPVFFYYPPLLFFVTSLLRPFFRGDSHGWYQLGVSASAALIASGACAYAWLKQVAGRNSALAAAILYMATPYHLASDLYVRGSLAEFWAFIWMPLILFFTHKIVQGQRLAPAGCAFSYALMIITHLPTTLIFSPIPICYSFYMAGTGRKTRAVGWTIGAMTLGAGISFVYLWPALTTQHLVFLDRMTTGYFSYKNWLFFTNFSLWPNEKFLVLLTTADLAGIACCAFIINRATPKSLTTRLNAFWFAIAGTSILMMTQLSAPIWVSISILRKIQFPWRFNAIVSLATSALLALAISSFKRHGSRSFKIATVMALFFVFAWLPGTGWAVLQAYPFHIADQEDVNYKYREIAEQREVPEYYPRWNLAMAEMNWECSVNEEEWDSQLNSRFQSLVQGIGESKVRIIEGTGDVSVSSWKAGEIRLQTSTPTGLRILVSQFYYPNWSASLFSNQEIINIQPSQPDGLISLSIPKGEHEVLLQLEQSSAETVGEIVSLISIAAVVSSCFWCLFVAKRRYQTLQ